MADLFEAAVACCIEDEEKAPQQEVVDLSCEDGQEVQASEEERRIGDSRRSTALKRKSLTGKVVPKQVKSPKYEMCHLVPRDAWNVMCVWVQPKDKTKQPAPVPLWGQYGLKWAGCDVEDEVWLSICPQETWIKSMVHMLFTGKHTRDIAKMVVDCMRPGLSVHVGGCCVCVCGFVVCALRKPLRCMSEAKHTRTHKRSKR